MNKEKLYVSYLKTEFDKNLLICEKMTLNPRWPINKPLYGFWASPINAQYGWKQLCINEGIKLRLGDIKFIFKLRNNSKIFNIRDIKDVEEKVPFYEYRGFLLIDFDKMRSDGYDGIELLDPCIGHYFYSNKELCFNTWDCESIVIWNPDIIIPIKEG